MAILITGGAGFIGSHLAETLLRSGENVVVLDNFDDYYDPGLKRRNIADLSAYAAFRLVEGDIRSRQDLERTLGSFEEGLEGVVHLAARPGVRASIANPVLTADLNVRGLVELLEFVRSHGIMKMVFASSSSVYGERGEEPFSEDDHTEKALSPYAATKKAGEALCWSYHHLYKTSISCLRFFTVYGPRQRPEMAIHYFTRLIDEGKELPLFGDGTAQRDFTFIEDTLQGIVKAYEACRGFNIYNLGNGRSVTMKRTIAAIEKHLQKSARIRWHDAHPGDASSTLADISRARRDLGYQPRVPFEEGIERFVKWYLEDKRNSG